MTLQTNDRTTEKLESFLDDTFQYCDVPGLAIGVSLGQASFEFIGVRGYADYSERVPLQKDSVFHCASVSKLFTSSAIMKLVERGILHLDDRLADLLPDLNIADRRSADIRLRHMLTHTSGIGDCADYHWDTPRYDEKALADYVHSDEVCLQPMLWQPGTEFRYSNVAYEILGHIVSVYASASYEDVIKRYCMEPAEMAASTMKTFERTGWHSDTAQWADASKMAFPYEKGSDRSIQPVKYYPYNRQHGPSSTLTSTVEDLLKWGRTHLRGAAGDRTDRSKASVFADSGIYDTIWSSYATVPNNGEKMGLGWFIRKQTVGSDAAKRDYTLYGHEGTDDGFRASFWICPQLDTVTVVLSNLSNAPVKKINKKLFAEIAFK